MSQVFRKIASNGATSQQFARVGDTSVILTLSHKNVTVKSGNSTNRIVKTLCDIRTEVAGKTCATSDCPPKYPALMQISVSAPEGALPADFKPALDAAYAALAGSLNSVFFPQIDEITV